MIALTAMSLLSVLQTTSSKLSGKSDLDFHDAACAAFATSNLAVPAYFAIRVIQWIDPNARDIVKSIQKGLLWLQFRRVA